MNLFRDVEVVHRFFGNTRVQWRWCDQAFLESIRPVAVTLEWAHTALGDWREAANAVVFDNGSALDPDQRLFGQDRSLFYRLRADAGGKAYYSEPAQIGDKRDALLARNIREAIRLLELNFRKNYHALEGCLYKRRVWGMRCPKCVDPATGEVAEQGCPVCLQTGVVRGYFPPWPLNVLLSNRKTRFNYPKPDMGSFVDHGLQGTAVAYPVPVDERDLWMNNATGEMFRISNLGQPVEESMRLGNIVLQQRFVLEMVPAGHILYRMQSYCCDNRYNPLYDKICEPYEKPMPECALPAGEETDYSCPDIDFGSPEEPPRTVRDEETLVWPE